MRDEDPEMALLARVAALEARAEAHERHAPTVGTLLRLAQLVGGILLLLSGLLAAVGIKTTRDMDEYAKREVDKHVPQAAEARRLFEEARAAADSLGALITQVAGTARDISAFKAVVESRPSPKALLIESMSEASAGNHTAAVDRLQKLLSASDDADADILHLAGLFAKETLGLRALARDLIERAHQKAPTHPHIFAELLELRAQDPSRRKSAAKDMADLAARHPHDDYVMRSAGNFYTAVSDFDGLRGFSEGLIRDLGAESDSTSARVSHVVFQLRASAAGGLHESPEISDWWWRMALTGSAGRDANVLRQYAEFLLEHDRCEDASRLVPRYADTVSEGYRMLKFTEAYVLFRCGSREEGCRQAAEVEKMGREGSEEARLLLLLCRERFTDAELQAMGVEAVEEEVGAPAEVQELLKELEKEMSNLEHSDKLDASPMIGP